MADLVPCKFKYYCYFINNESVGEDDQKALFMSKTLERLGYSPNYVASRDACPGHSYFDEHFETLASSLFVLIILTQEFLQSSWEIYCQNSAFFELLNDQQGYRLIPIAFGLRKDEIPKELNVKRVLFLPTSDWREMKEDWTGKLDRALKSGIEKYRMGLQADDCLSLTVSNTAKKEGAFSEMKGGDSEFNMAQKREADEFVFQNEGLEYQNYSFIERSYSYYREKSFTISPSTENTKRVSSPNPVAFSELNISDSSGSPAELESFSSVRVLLSSGWNKMSSVFSSISLPSSNLSFGEHSFRMACHLLSKPDQPYF